MRKYLLFTAFSLFILAGCNSKKAFNFSEEIVKKEQSLKPVIEKAQADVAAANASGDYAKIAAVGKDMEKQMDERITEIKGMSVSGMKKGEELKAAAVEYFEFMKSVYTTYKKYGEATTDEARETERAKVIELSNGKMDEVQKIQSVQKDFASANGFTVK